jgi:hypothetical protein
VVAQHLAPIYEAFWLLSATRSSGFGTVNPISVVDALALSDLIEPDDPLRFLRVIREIDALFLKHLAEDRERKAKAKKPRT